jgi:hypothetical protein
MTEIANHYTQFWDVHDQMMLISDWKLRHCVNGHDLAIFSTWTHYPQISSFMGPELYLKSCHKKKKKQT